MKEVGASLPPCLFLRIDGPAVPKARVARMPNGRAVTRRRTRQFERAVANAGWVAKVCWEKEHGEKWPMGGRYRLTIECRHTDRRRRDLSNLVKSIEDGLNGVWWDDDSQVDEFGPSRKLGGQPAAVVFVRVELLREAA